MGIGRTPWSCCVNHFGLSPWLGRAAALAFRRAGRRRDRLSVLPLQDRRPLLRARHARAVGGGAPGDRRAGATRPAARSAPRPTSALHGGASAAPGALQFSDKQVWFWIVLAFWLRDLVWRAVDRSMARLALQAISEEEEAAASIGIHVTRAKLRITSSRR